MSHDDKSIEEVEVIITKDGGGMRKIHIAVKGPLAVFLVIFLGLFSITGYLWATGNEKPESIQLPEEHTFPGLNYRIYDTIKEQRFSRSA